MKTEVALMVKAPRPGFCKTRLAASLGPEVSAAIYSALVRWQLAQIPAHWRTAVHFAPSNAEMEVRRWLSDCSRGITEFHPQVDGDLGERMRHAVADGLNRADAVILIGGDCPGLTTALFLQVEKGLRKTAGPVIVPATDGGYVLLGLRQRLDALFQQIPWSTSKVCALTIARSRFAGLDPMLFPALTDIDDLDSLLPHRVFVENHLPDYATSDEARLRLGMIRFT